MKCQKVHLAEGAAIWGLGQARSIREESCLYWALQCLLLQLLIDRVLLTGYRME